MSFISQTTSATAAPDLVIPNIPCDTSVSVGTWVIVTAGVAFLANANSITTSNVFGLVESMSSPTICNVRALGISAVKFSGLVESSQYYLAADGTGNMTTTPPSQTGQVIVKLGQPFNNSSFLVLKNIVAVRG